MTEKTINIKAPRGLTRLLYRAPIWLYRFGLGGLIGEKHVLLNHIGRRSGKPRQAVVEIIRHDKVAKAYIVASGLGEKSDWFQNLMAHPDITIQVGRKRMAAHAERLLLHQATQILLDYSHRNARGMRGFASMIGYHIVDYEEGVRFLIRVIRVVSLATTDLQEK
jgi:deazaflavin-dependent oxidoreductase (nitroreductase family)